MKLDDDARAILGAKSFAQVALVTSKGEPFVTPMWVDVDEEDRIVLNTAEGRVKARLMQLGTAVAICALDPDDPYRYVFVRGSIVERTHHGAEDVINALAHKYRGRDFVIKPGEQRVTVLVEPERFYVY